MWSRRETIAGGMLTLLFGGCCAHAGSAHAQSSRTPHTLGCCLATEDVDAVYPNGTDTRTFFTGDEPMIPRSGDRDFDYALAQTLAKISDAFGVLPGFAYYDDSDSRNAYATSRTRLNRADGTVLMGMYLLQQLRTSKDHPEIGVTAVCSHEFGHILQYRHNLVSRVNAGQSTVKRSELQADYFAGFYAGLRKKERPTYQAAVVAVTQGNYGDTHFNSPTHHGTEQERSAAVVRGFNAAFREGKSLAQAIEESTNYVLTL
jgi:hypothetical protein